ncbi:MAG: transglutaminase family protein [Proteobacteria bacterium]|nr:transglutaminase family protein [Pseudomonadota bacterium]
MHIRVGYEISYQCPQATPMLLMLNVHPSRVADLLQPDPINTDPPVPVLTYGDRYGNRCARIIAPAGRITLRGDTVVQDAGLPDPVHPAAIQHPVEDLPSDALLYLLGSRYCETDLLMETAWRLFANAPMGWGRVQAICDFVHGWIKFDYMLARATRTAQQTYAERQGVCRDYAHLALTLCRCMNIPARYCTGYLGDIGVPPDPSPMDFSGWFEAYLGGQWHTFDARHNTPRIGRILLGRGRDATDVAISTTFGPNTLAGFRVWTDQIA